MMGSVSRQEAILSYSSSIINFGAFMALSKVLACVPGIFKLLQGGSQWTAKLRGTAEADKSAISAMKQLVYTMRDLGNSLRRAELMAEVVRECKQQQDEMIRRAVHEYGEMTEEEAATTAVRMEVVVCACT